MSADPSGFPAPTVATAYVVVRTTAEPAQSVTVRVTLSVGACFNCDDGGGSGARFIRGDTSGDGSLDLTDPIQTFGFLFLGDPSPGCLLAADSNDSAAVDLSDGIYTLSFLFLGGPEPPAPFPRCGEAATLSPLACETQASCLAR